MNHPILNIHRPQNLGELPEIKTRHFLIAAAAAAAAGIYMMTRTKHPLEKEIKKAKKLQEESDKKRKSLDPDKVTIAYQLDGKRKMGTLSQIIEKMKRLRVDGYVVDVFADESEGDDQYVFGGSLGSISILEKDVGEDYITYSHFIADKLGLD